MNKNMKCPNIKFSHNWNNKLNCNVFTTIRKCTASKLKYYYDQLGKEFNVMLNDQFRGSAILRDVTVLRIENVNPTLLELDVGSTDRGETLDIFKRFGISYGTDVIILQFENKKRKRCDRECMKEKI